MGSQTPEALKELYNVNDFESIANAEGLISIGGFGSLLSERSARYTFPALSNFRIARLSGFRRIFAHVAPIFFERGIAKPETKEISSLSVEPCSEESILITVFEIGISEVFPEDLGKSTVSHPAVVCARYSDEEYLEHRCKGSKDEFYKNYGRYGIDKIWRDDILPCRAYLRHCVLAAKNLGSEVYENFLDHTFLGDRLTTIRQHLELHPQIMHEEPPPHLKERYGG
ncbi:hypothetical protein KP509_24G064500 [Ceratopteris richardii]|uniref:Uncharacterized protein n=1 Tax=Ceratopteris richardii TaxID=49495 RepID=A0A8T2RVS1_CERRI|nr:hypothetical protein KP509_24G064500 [Ceratopteris richardii]